MEVENKPISSMKYMMPDFVNALKELLKVEI